MVARIVVFGGLYDSHCVAGEWGRKERSATVPYVLKKERRRNIHGCEVIFHFSCSLFSFVHSRGQVDAYAKRIIPPIPDIWKSYFLDLVKTSCRWLLDIHHAFRIINNSKTPEQRVQYDRSCSDRLQDMSALESAIALIDLPTEYLSFLPTLPTL